MKFASFWNRIACCALLSLPCHWAASQQSNTDTPKSKSPVAKEAAETSPTRLPQTEILAYRAADGAIQTAQSPAEWEARRREVLAGMEAIMGAMPGEEKRVPLDVRIDSEVDCGSYVRRLITYQSEPGSRVPAYLSIPKALLADDAKPAAAVLCLHPTDNSVGHKVVVGLGGKANRQYAAELAERGFVTLAPSYPLLANYQPDLEALGWTSGTLKAIWDNMRGIDLLQSLPYVRKESIGAIGHSLGGHNAVYTAVFDPRIGAIVSSCGLDSFLDYYGSVPSVWQLGSGWTSTRYMPRLAEYRGRLEEIPFDFHELIAALAPRPMLIVAPLHDSNFQHDSVDRVADTAKKVYQLHNAADRLQVEHPDCDHDFPEAMRLKAYKLFTDTL
ncbi:alpha/beta hydrolase family protein [Rosistilla oblonga]|uniref:alpha/beta hydrolase family protein n=1 Tax=Rosistilla oblonga TaxID=2527990 RepID=UPI003A984496